MTLEVLPGTPWITVGSPKYFRDFWSTPQALMALPSTLENYGVLCGLLIALIGSLMTIVSNLEYSLVLFRKRMALPSTVEYLRYSLGH